MFRVHGQEADSNYRLEFVRATWHRCAGVANRWSSFLDLILPKVFHLVGKVQIIAVIRRFSCLRVHALSRRDTPCSLAAWLICRLSHCSISSETIGGASQNSRATVWPSASITRAQSFLYSTNQRVLAYFGIAKAFSVVSRSPKLASISYLDFCRLRFRIRNLSVVNDSFVDMLS